MRRIATPVVILLLWSTLFYIVSALPALAAELTAQQKADLQFFNLDPNSVDGDVLLKKLYGGCDYNPYEVLEKQYRGGGADRCNVNGVSITPKNGSTAGIDSALACRLTKLFKAANDRGCQVKVSSAYRSEASQACMCGAGRTGCAPAGASCHQRGLAVDVSSGCIGWMRMAAPQFQLVFPYYGDHIQCAEHPGASTRSCNRPCDGGVPINPDLSRLPAPSQVPETYFVPPPNAGASTPTSGLTSGIRSALGMTPAPAPAPTSAPTTQSQSQTQSQICTPKFTCTGNVSYYQTSSCSTQVHQVCQYGCAGNACAVSTSTAATSSSSNLTGSPADIGTGTDITNTNDNSNNEDTGSEQSVSDLINAFATGPTFSSTDIGTSTSITFVLNPNTGEIEELRGTLPSPADPTNPGTITSIQPVGGQQTFVSGDINSGYVPLYGTQQTSTFQAVLKQLESALLWALDVLKPFGGVNPAQVNYIE